MSFCLPKMFVIAMILCLTQHIYAQKPFCIYFEAGKSALTPQLQAEIDKTCQGFSIKDTLQIEIIGYFDSKNGKTTTDLARKRCYAVWDYLLQKKNFIIFKGQMLPSSTYKPENLPTAETAEMTQKRVCILFIPVKKGKLMNPSIAESLPNVPTSSTSTTKNNTTTAPVFGSNLPKANQNVGFGTFSSPTLNEADTVITFRTGTSLKIAAGTFAPLRIKDVQIDIMEFLKPCELFSLDVQMRTIDGNLLISDGLVIIQTSKNGKLIQPQKPLEIWIPSEKLDTTMRLYVGDRTLDNRTIWRRANERLSFHITDARYYSFETQKLGWFCIQKPIDESISLIISAKDNKTKKNRFFVKNNSHPNPQVSVFYLDNHTYYELSASEEGVFSMPKFSDPKNVIIVSKVHAPNNKTWYFSKRLSELEYKGGSYFLNTEDYIVRRPNSPKNTSQGDLLTMDEVLYKLCGMFSEMKGI